MADIKIAFWNLQNLFDTTISEIAADFEYTPQNGWNEETFDKKIENLSTIINKMHNDTGPDLLGVCEIENDDVVQALIDETGRSDYRIVHHQSPDIRGIDVALVYSEDIFELIDSPKAHKVYGRYPTRDILQAKFRVKQNNSELHVLVNHWPSRRMGKYESEPLRIAVADYAGRLVDEILKISRTEFLALPDTQGSLSSLNDVWDNNVILMGDFNDEPFDRSMMYYLQAVRDLDNLEEPIKKSAGNSFIPNAKSYLEKKATLYNCMWRFLSQPDVGTFFYNEGQGNPMNILDQFVISRGLYYGKKNLKMDQDSVAIFTDDIVGSNSKKRPKAFDKSTRQGFSDHFPIVSSIKTV
ncbi:MAG: endonuclease/exonuclease/phosphatase family protein [Thermoproteota archaeon]